MPTIKQFFQTPVQQQIETLKTNIANVQQSAPSTPTKTTTPTPTSTPVPTIASQRSIQDIFGQTPQQIYDEVQARADTYSQPAQTAPPSYTPPMTVREFISTPPVQTIQEVQERLNIPDTPAIYEIGRAHV